MKVALIIEHFDATRGAAEHLAVWVANALAKGGHEVHVVCHDVTSRINRYRQATQRAMFCGKICRIVSCHVCGAVCGTCAPSAGGGSTMPSPARLIEMAAQPISNANVVTTSK